MKIHRLRDLTVKSLSDCLAEYPPESAIIFLTMGTG